MKMLIFLKFVFRGLLVYRHRSILVLAKLQTLPACVNCTDGRQPYRICILVISDHELYCILKMPLLTYMHNFR